MSKVDWKGRYRPLLKMHWQENGVILEEMLWS